MPKDEKFGAMYDHSLKPITEGYQPSLQKGYQPTGTGGQSGQSSSPASPPKGGSSAMQPQKAAKE